MTVGTWWAVVGWALGGASAGALFCGLAIRAERKRERLEALPSVAPGEEERQAGTD